MPSLFDSRKPLLVAIDAQSVAYRGFYAMRRKPLRSSTGMNTSAVYYYDTLLRGLLKRFKPTYGVVGFDTKEPTFRHRIMKEYKAQRPETPDELIPQIEVIKDLTEAWGVKAVAKPGYEADDILASAATLAKEAGIPAILVTSDKDLMALIDDKVKVLNVADERIYDREAVLKKYGVLPEQLPDFLVLVGDPADNISGVKGIGRKIAIDLLKRFGSLKGILEHLEEVERLNRRAAAAIRRAVESGELERLVELVRLSPKPLFTLEDIRVREPDRDRLVAIYRSLDFYSPLKEIAVRPALPSPKPYGGEDVRGMGYDGKVLYLSDGRDILINQAPPEGKTLYTVDLKGAYRKGLRPSPHFHDLGVGDYLLWPEIEEESRKNRHDLEFLALKYMGWEVVEPVEAFRAYLSARIGEGIISKLEEEGLLKIYEEIELPLVEVLASMEEAGVKVDVGYLKALGEEIDRRIKEYEGQIYALAGHPFNLNSPKQLAKVLFEELGLPPVKKTKTGYSTDVEVLTTLANTHPLPALILRYRELFKVKSTYVQGLLKYVGEDGRIHPTFSQTTTATGRLSCYNPNLQNVPARGEWGEKVRRAFVPEEGYIFADYDYSQIELRVLAHLSGDENLTEIFLKGGDIHTETARALFGKEEITPDERRVAKTVNFGIIYGISPYGLSKALGIGVEEAKGMIERYYSRFPKVREWQEEVMEFAREKGYVQTIFGRRRYVFADPFTNDVWRRIVINTPVQGSAADIIKVAMLRVHSLLKGLRSRLLLQVHDELLLEVAEGEEGIIPKVKEEMEGAVELKVPVRVDFGTGKSWAEAHR